MANSEQANKSIKLILFGNAVLDIGKRVKDDAIHRKYKLKLDDQLELDSSVLESIKRDLDGVAGKSHVASGGSCLNTCKILNQLGEEGTVFCGGIGSDENGQILEKLLDKNNITRYLQRMPDYTTALCICLIHNESRCLVANIGASMHFNSIATVDKVVEKVISSRSTKADSLGVLCYIEGYFIPYKMQICKHIWERIRPMGGQLVLNLNATYIVEKHSGDVLWLFERAHLVFGNRREFNQLLAMTENDSVPNLLAVTPLSSSSSSSCGERICVVTDGANRVQYFRQTNNDISSAWMVVPKVETNLVVDSTGAGDAFVAGFLHQYLDSGHRREDTDNEGDCEWLAECIRLGVEIARRKLSFFGCTIKNGDDANEELEVGKISKVHGAELDGGAA